MAPYALALGVIRPYADTFGRRKLEHCPYLFTRNDTGRHTAEEWGELMRSTALKMDARAKQMRWERWFAVPVLIPLGLAMWLKRRQDIRGRKRLEAQTARLVTSSNGEGES